jgi:hypothetical protein
MRAWLSFTLAGMLGLAAVAAGQSLPGSGSMGGIGDKRRAPPDPVVLEGPPETQDFAALIGIDSTQRQRYDSLYRRLMDKTRADREAMATARQRLRGAADGEMTPAMRGTLTRLDGMQKAFDDALHELLNKSQWKAYQKWRDERRDQAVQ